MKVPHYLLYLFALTPLSWARPCPCSQPSFCHRIEYTGKEVHGIILPPANGTTLDPMWASINWRKLTTVTLVDFFHDHLLCAAHEQDVRVLTQETISLSHLDNSTYVTEWLRGKVTFAQDHFTDGITLLIDDPISPEDTRLANKLTSFVASVTQNFHEALPGSIVVFTVPFSPYNQQNNATNGQAYDYPGLARAVDQFFLLDMDQRLQSDGPCVAGANADYYYTVGGLLAYQSLSIPSDKLVLALPYYAHDYECLVYTENFRCYVAQESYRGSKCSSKVARKLPYNEFGWHFQELRGHDLWDEHSGTYIHNYMSSHYDYAHQVFYDQSHTLILKFGLADKYGLRGVGMWALNYMAPGNWTEIPDLRNKPLD